MPLVISVLVEAATASPSFSEPGQGRPRLHVRAPRSKAGRRSTAGLCSVRSGRSEMLVCECEYMSTEFRCCIAGQCDSHEGNVRAADVYLQKKIIESIY
jgi:hypothetical protein